MLPEVDYGKLVNERATGYEYLIITPDNPAYLAWADSIKIFRQQQGIKTGIVTLTQIGGNTTTAIENILTMPITTWDIPPAAIYLWLIMVPVMQPLMALHEAVYNLYCISDHMVC
jgi:hypothetical protein